MNHDSSQKEEEEDEFSDFGFENLPQSTIQDLESGALSSAKHQQQLAAAAATTSYNKQDYKSFAPSNHQRLSTLGHDIQQQSAPSFTTNLPLPDPHPESSDNYDFGEEDVIDLDEPSLVIHTNSEIPPHHDFDQTHPRHDHDQTNQTIDVPSQQPLYQKLDTPRPSSSEIHALHTRIKELEDSLKSAEIASFKKAGENQIIRARIERETNEYERRLAALIKTHAQELANHKADAEAARKDRDLAETNNRFLHHDLAHESSKRFKPSTNPSAPRNPHKKPTQSTNKPLQPAAPYDIPFRDGFDDHTAIIVSPTKLADKSKPATPRAGDKRKRKLQLSPPPPLLLGDLISRNSPPVSEAADAQTPLSYPGTANTSADESHFQTIQHILNHRPPTGSERTLEVLTKQAFPSAPEKSIAGLVVDMLTRYIPTKNNRDLHLYVCNVLFDLWSTCLDQRYYAPIHALVDLVEFVLALGSESTANELVSRFIPLATKSIDLVAVPLARPSDTTKQSLKTDGASSVSDEVNVDHILIMMHRMSIFASLSVETNQAFWQKMEFDFVLMMLNVPQQLPHMQLMLQMVAASVLPDSFGAISKQPAKQTSLETHTIDRLTNLLFEQPIAPSEEPPYEDTELALLRVETVRTLTAIAVTEHGSCALAQHGLAIGRLVRFIHIQVTSVYDIAPSSISGGIDEGLVIESGTVHSLTAQVISLAIRLVYHILQHHADLINLREKLAVIPGGHHKFLVSLTRLAFSEQLVYEAGIDEEAVDAAHEILDNVLSPEEGDAVFEAIETPRGSNSMTASSGVR